MLEFCVGCTHFPYACLHLDVDVCLLNSVMTSAVYVLHRTETVIFLVFNRMYITRGKTFQIEVMDLYKDS